MDYLNLYIDEFRTLNVHRSGGEMAPHKPVLVLSVIDLIETGHIYRNRVYLDDSLQHKFKELWKLYVPSTSKFRCSITYPFFHLGNDKFWRLIPSCEYVKQGSYYSISSIHKNFECAIIDQDLFDILQHPACRETLRNELISTFLACK